MITLPCPGSRQGQQLCLNQQHADYHTAACLAVLHVQGGRCVLPWWLRLRVAAQISAAIAYLHTLPASVGGPLIHRDIKPANMFLDGRLNAKVGACVYLQAVMWQKLSSVRLPFHGEADTSWDGSAWHTPAASSCLRGLEQQLLPRSPHHNLCCMVLAAMSACRERWATTFQICPAL
jgi:serine/threonine protein kinase